jgi:hypothetical protein
MYVGVAVGAWDSSAECCVNTCVCAIADKRVCVGWQNLPNFDNAIIAEKKFVVKHKFQEI